MPSNSDSSDTRVSDSNSNSGSDTRVSDSESICDRGSTTHSGSGYVMIVMAAVLHRCYC